MTMKGANFPDQLIFLRQIHYKSTGRFDPRSGPYSSKPLFTSSNSWSSTTSIVPKPSPLSIQLITLMVFVTPVKR